MHAREQSDGDDPLDTLSAERAELFALRVERWLPDLRDALTALYPSEEATALEQALLASATRAYAARPAELHRRDLQRMLAPDWFQRSDMIGYAAYADRFAGDLAGVQAQIPYLTELGVTYLHLMPLLRPRDGDSDGGYAVADYRSVRPDLGTVADLEKLARELHEAGISLVLDLVLNHVAAEHEWARRARAGERRYREYFHVFPHREVPDAYERTLPEVFPAFAPGNFTWDDGVQGWVWTTFNAFQWDVNWANPSVFAEYADILLWLANLGVDVVRLDAIAFVWKRLGTSCQNQPEVHAVAQGLRALLRIAAPAVLLKAEAIVAPEDLVQYLGRGRYYGKVSDLAYHNSLMVQVWSMLATRDVRLAERALTGIPAIPASTAWICYVRCHDDIGWAIDDGDAAAVGLDGAAHRAFLTDFYTGSFPGSHATGVAFQANPATGDRRVSGMAASLAGLDAAREVGDERQLDDAVARILLAHAIVLGWGGVPVLWMGDELGLASDGHWADEAGHEADNRWLHRPRMDREAQAARRRAGSIEARIFDGLRRLAAARAGRPELHVATAPQVLPPDDPGVLPVLHDHPEGALLQLYNVTGDWRPFAWKRVAELGLDGGRDVLTGDAVARGDDGNLWLSPLSAVWIARDR